MKKKIRKGISFLLPAQKNSLFYILLFKSTKNMVLFYNQHMKFNIKKASFFSAILNYDDDDDGDDEDDDKGGIVPEKERDFVCCLRKICFKKIKEPIVILISSPLH